MFNSTNTRRLAGVVVAMASLSGCGGDESDAGTVLLTCDVPQIPDATGTSCVAPPPIHCPLPTVPDASNESCVIGLNPDAVTPSIFAQENQTILFYNRPQDADNSSSDPVYDGYRLHTWNDDVCDAYAAPYDTSDWGNGHEFDGIDPTYGAYWVIPLKEGYSDCGNFVIHIGTESAGKELGGNDKQMPLMQDDPDYVRMNFTLSGNSDIYEYPIASLGPQPIVIDGAAAHWIDESTFAWAIEMPAQVKLHYSSDASLTIDPETETLNGTAVDLAAMDLTPELQASAPQVASWSGFSGDWDTSQAKMMAKSQMVLAAYDDDGALLKATFVQSGKALDALYTAGENDADEMTLGATYDGDAINLALWAPTAQSVTVNFYNDDKSLASSAAMTEDAATGVWSHAGDMSLDRMFYRYEVSVYHPVSSAIEVLDVTDPYSLSLSTDSNYSQFVNLDDESLKPEGWEGHAVPSVMNPEDAIIYEGHIRDFSILDNSTSEANRGKYLAFTEMESTPVRHLKTLVENGLTHFQFLPSNDIASIKENPDHIVNINDTVADLCRFNSDAAVCGVEDETAVILDVLNSYSPFTNDARDLVEAMRSRDSFNWGYDPKHFNAPEGSYATDADGVARIIEMRAMNKALHDIGLRIVMDVVYNHTNSSGLWDNSVLDKVVPGYYHSRDLLSGGVIQSTCCEDTALEHRMMDKLMQDSLIGWTEHYGVDGFRFDIMSHGSKEQMLAARAAVQEIDADNYFYGEGWGRDNRGFTHADQGNMAGTEIATFNDRLRDGIRNGALFSEDGSLTDQDVVRFGMAGTLSDYVLKDSNGNDTSGKSFSPNMYALDPADNINYISKHDNETLWDKLQLGNPMDQPLSERSGLAFTTSSADRVRAQNLAHSIVLMSQGIPFIQMGSDLLRSKSLDRNTYDAGDWYNRVDFEMETNNWSIGLPLDAGQQSEDDLISLSANPYINVTGDDIAFASTIFNEFLSIRSANPLLRLTTSDDIINRIGFHNIGKNQAQGLIVMSIDDGVELTDLDPMVDALVVIVNAKDYEQSHAVPTATGFELIATQQESMDSIVAGASFSEGTFTVPPLTTAVFVKPQGEVQGEGLSAYATSGAPDVVPYGSTAVYVRGGMNGWGEVDDFTYLGDGVYQASVVLAQSDEGIEFKIASGDWSTVDFGALSGEEMVAESVMQTLTRSGANMKFVTAVAGTYLFTLDASDADAPTLEIHNEDVYAATPIYLRGGVNGWGTANELVHLGKGLYSTTMTIATAGAQDFKVADADWADVNLGAVISEVEIGQWSQLLSGSNDNFNFEFEASDYTFLLDASDSAAQSVSLFKSLMFGETEVYLRGGMNGWGTDNPFVYQGNGVYSVTLDVTAGDYQFKFASSDWSTINLGVGETALVPVGRSVNTLQGSNNNLSITIETDGAYTFSVTGPDVAAPTIIVSKVD